MHWERVLAVLSATMSVEDLADFGLREAHQCRKQWASFVDRCWEYVAEACKVKEAEDPPELNRLKAQSGGSHVDRRTLSTMASGAALLASSPDPMGTSLGSNESESRRRPDSKRTAEIGSDASHLPGVVNSEPGCSSDSPKGAEEAGEGSGAPEITGPASSMRLN